jgi:hypothetical protein
VLRLSKSASPLFFAAIAVCLTNKSEAATIIPSFDSSARAPTTETIPENSNVNNLAVGPVSGLNDFFRTYLTFDLSGATAASDVSLTLVGNTGSENNTTALEQTFTLFVLAADWDGATPPFPDGTDVASVTLTPGNPQHTANVTWTNTPGFLSAFNGAVGGNLFLGIRSDAEGSAAGTRSFAFFASLEDTGSEPVLTYNPVPEPGSLGLLAVAGAWMLARRRATGR